MKHKKALILSLFICILLALSSVTVFADENPSWFPEDLNGFSDYHNEDAPRVVDKADLFTDAEEADLTERIYAYIAAHDLDLVLYTDDETYWYGDDRDLQAADFYQFNGYGLGDDYSGGVLFMQVTDGHGGWRYEARGEARDYINEDAINYLDNMIESDMIDGYYYDAAVKYIGGLDRLASGEEPPMDLTGPIILGLLVGLALFGIVFKILRKNMKTVATASEASVYMVPNSLKINRAKDIFLYMNVIRVKRQDNNKSNYKGGFGSSGGGSFSGGGRDF